MLKQAGFPFNTFTSESTWFVDMIMAKITTIIDVSTHLSKLAQLARSCYAINYYNSVFEYTMNMYKL